MIIVQAPQTSSRQPLSQTGGVVVLPSTVTGRAAMYWRQEMMFMFGRRGTANSSQRIVSGRSGESWRRMRMRTVRSAGDVVGVGVPGETGCGWPLPGEADDGGESVTVG